VAISPVRLVSPAAGAVAFAVRPTKLKAAGWALVARCWACSASRPALVSSAAGSPRGQPKCAASAASSAAQVLRQRPADHREDPVVVGRQRALDELLVGDVVGELDARDGLPKV
jgi:hypothetical protein